MKRGRLIDEDELIRKVASIPDLRTFSTKTIGKAISECATIDAVEVVRCKDCYSNYTWGLCPWQLMGGAKIGDDWFCPFGVKKVQELHQEIAEEEKMTFQHYVNEAQRTSNTKGCADKLFNGALGLTGEAGEVADIVKKHKFQEHPLDRAAIIEECGDVLWYIAEIATALNVSLEEIAIRNIDKLRNRYPKGFDSEKSINRKE